MNKAHEIAKIKRIEAMADDCIAVARQLEVTATRLKSEATTALMELADSKGGGRKAPKYVMSDAERIATRARMTRGAKLNTNT